MRCSGNLILLESRAPTFDFMSVSPLLMLIFLEMNGDLVFRNLYFSGFRVELLLGKPYKKRVC